MAWARDEEGARAIISRASSPRGGRADRVSMLNMITPRRTDASPPLRLPRSICEFRADPEDLVRPAGADEGRGPSAPLPSSPLERPAVRNLRLSVPILCLGEAR